MFAYNPYPKVELSSLASGAGHTGAAAYKSKFVDYSSSSAHQNQPAPLRYNPVPFPANLNGNIAMGGLNMLLPPDGHHSTAASVSPTAKTSSSSRMSESPHSGSESMDSNSVLEHSTGHCHSSSRKRRRGVIEKRRRDRINHSLAELRRLVPSAFEKQGSTKLEKAEILQMTVDHLKTIHTKGINYATNGGLDPHMMGFQECVAEIQRFIVQDEHFSAQEQLRNRLISHLQCYTAQRETFKNSPQSYASHSHSGYPTGPTGLVPPPPPVGLNCGPESAPSCLGTYSSSSAASSTATSNPSSFTPMVTSNGPSAATTVSHHHHQYTAAFPAMQTWSSAAVNYAGNRAYRPWGSELVY